MKIIIEGKDKRNMVNLAVSNIYEVKSFIYGGIQECNSICLNLQNCSDKSISVLVCTTNLPEDVHFVELYDCFKFALANQELDVTLELADYKNWKEKVSKIK